MYMFAFEGMLEAHIIDESALKKIQHENPNNPYKVVFEHLLVGVNISSLEAINDIAVYLSKLTEDEVKKITYEDVIKNVGCFTDSSGYLV